MQSDQEARIRALETKYQELLELLQKVSQQNEANRSNIQQSVRS